MSAGALVALGMMGIGPFDYLSEEDNEEEKDSEEVENLDN